MSIVKRRSQRRDDERVRYILPRNNGEISNSITQNWTDQAVICYKHNFDCANCSIAQGNYSFVCQMPNIVKTLLEEVGPPDENKISKVIA